MPELQDLLKKLETRLLDWANQFILMLPNLVVAVFLIVVAAFASRWVETLVLRVTHRMSGNRPISNLLGTLSRLAVMAVVVFIALGLLNLDKTVTSLLAGVGVVGLALGFAFQDIAANFMSGFLMALRGPFKPGDLVEVAGHKGHVQHISLRASELETLDGLSVLIPNKDIFQSAIVNYTLTSRRRMDLTVGTAYGDDMEVVRDVVRRALKDVPHRDQSCEPEVLFESFGDSSINFTARVWLDHAEERFYLDARSEAMIAIKRALDANNLTIPFPIRTLDFGGDVVGGVGLKDVPLRVTGRTGSEG